MNIKDIAELSYKLLTPLIAITVALIAYQQYRLSKLNLRTALFDRRNKVFESVTGFLAWIVQNGTVDQGELVKLLRESRECFFLFNEEISEYIKELYNKGNRLRFVNSRLDDERLPVGEERDKLAKENEELQKFFSEQFEITRKKFKKYLDLGRKP